MGLMGMELIGMELMGMELAGVRKCYMVERDGREGIAVWQKGMERKECPRFLLKKHVLVLLLMLECGRSVIVSYAMVIPRRFLISVSELLLPP